MHKIRFSILVFMSVLVLSQAVIVEAQVGQTGTLSIVPGAISFSHRPDDFSFPTDFIPNAAQTINAYKTLDPGITNDTLRIFDSDGSSGFDVTVSLDDFETVGGGNNVIHYTELALVTLSSSLVEPVDSGATNVPPGAPNVLAPLDCNWNPAVDPLMETACDAGMIPFNEPAANSTDLAGDVSPADLVIDVIDGSQLSSATPASPKKIIINGDIIEYTGINVNQLTGVTNIDQSHLTGAVVTQYYDSSQQIAIMSNAVTGDTGEYSIGFGFRLTYNETTIPDSYSSTLTFTLIPVP